jgi:DNA-binding CsgD family transcriptional regulator
MSQPARASIRLAELLGVLSLGTDLGMGQGRQHRRRGGRPVAGRGPRGPAGRWRGRGRTVPAGHPASRRAARPAGLTGREIEVLRLLARGLSNKEIAERLVISRKTVGHHVEHIYAKTGTANRALVSLFAANHGLLADSSAPPAADVTPGTAGSPSTGPASR